jgi:hypothetical protein
MLMAHPSGPDLRPVGDHVGYPRSGVDFGTADASFSVNLAIHVKMRIGVIRWFTSSQRRDRRPPGQPREGLPRSF